MPNCDTVHAQSKSACGKMAEGSVSTEEELLPQEGAKNTGIW